MLSIVVAMTPTGLIGINNQLPWGHMPADLTHFKNLTLNKSIIMGRKTLQSIGKALPKRQNIILTRQTDFHYPGCEIAHSFSAALNIAKHQQEVMIIGGSEIFKLAIPQTRKMYITYIHYTGTGDTYFPNWNPHNWREVSRQSFSADNHNAYDYEFVEYQRETAG